MYWINSVMQCKATRAFKVLAGLLLSCALFPFAAFASFSADNATELLALETIKKSEKTSVNQETQKTVERTAEKVAGKMVAKVAEQAAADAATKAELTAKRPNEWMGPTKVNFLVFIIDIDNIDDADQSFSSNVYIRLRWRDERLAHPGSEVRQIPLESVWNPRVLLANQTGLIPKSLPDVVQVDEDGTVIYHQRYTGNLSQRLLLSDFPRDKHSFVVQFAAAGYSDDQVEFIPDSHPSRPDILGGSIADDLSLPDWKILSFEASKLTYKPIEAIHTAGFGMTFEAQRYITYYLWQLVLPLVVVVAMSWAAFWISRSEKGVRLGVATSSVLTLIANRFVFATLLPHLPYMTRMDYLTVGSTLLVLLSLFMIVGSAFLESKGKHHLTMRLDLWARGVFPTTFLILLGWFLFA